MSNYTNQNLPYPHHVNEEKRLITVFLPGGMNSVKMVQMAQKGYPGYLVQFTENYRYLDKLHGGGDGFAN